MEQSAIMRDRITEEGTKAVRAKFHEKHAICENKNVYILLPFLLITVPLLIAVSI